MRRCTLCVVLLVATVVCTVVIHRFTILHLTSSELKVSNLLRVPIQESAITIECTRGFSLRLENANGEWSVIQDHPPCAVSGIALQPVKATATEMVRLKFRPLFSFQVAATGMISNVKLLRSSGSTTLDERAIRQVFAHRSPSHNCGVCKMSTSVNVDFQGPVWMREPARPRISVH